jgi:hypothetical protein
MKRIMVQSQHRANNSRDPVSKKPITKNRLADWFKW